MSDRVVMVWVWGLKQFFKMVGGVLGRRPPSLLACCSMLSLVLLYLVGWPLKPPSGSLSRLAFYLRWSKITRTASSPDAWLVAMSRSSFVVRMFFHPSLCTRVSLVVPKMKALITSASARLVSLLHCREKRRMQSLKVSSEFCRQFFWSHGLPRRTYVPWKFPTNISSRSVQLWIHPCLWLSSHAHSNLPNTWGGSRLQSHCNLPLSPNTPAGSLLARGKDPIPQSTS